MLFIPITIAASALQVARNAAQRGLVGPAGPWGATLVRFLFGLPFALAAVLVMRLLRPHAVLNFTPGFFLDATAGAVSQLLATAALLAAMRASGFAIATAFQQSSLLMAALIGWAVFHEVPSHAEWLGSAVASLGLIGLSWPRRGGASVSLAGAGWGLASGVLFGFALNAYRFAALGVSPGEPALASTITVAFTQAIQSAGLVLLLGLFARASLASVVRSWRVSLTAGACGAFASICWLAALSLASAAQVRAVGVVEMPIAALVGRRLFAEKLSMIQWIAGAATALGVIAAALG
ncbi:MAG: EamA/RhaT family transporter [Caulobacteraceae bacterium]|nr:EamA/RhaT family transporter [Caulobacteraceae bacterium]